MLDPSGHDRRDHLSYVCFFSQHFCLFTFCPDSFRTSYAWIILKINFRNVCIPLPPMVSVSTDVWPLTWSDRLTHFLGAAWEFYHGLWLVWSVVLFSTMVLIHALHTEVVTSCCCDEENRSPGWHGKTSGRICRDWLQMLFWGLSAYLTRSCWNTNLPSPLLHCIICEITREATMVQLPLLLEALQHHQRQRVMT